MNITLSDNALARVQQFLQREGGVGLRFGVRRTGCSGWAYDVGIADTVHDDDHHFRAGDIDIYVDDKSLGMVAGTHIDFVQQGLNQTLPLTTPTSKPNAAAARASPPPTCSSRQPRHQPIRSERCCQCCVCLSPQEL